MRFLLAGYIGQLQWTSARLLGLETSLNTEATLRCVRDELLMTLRLVNCNSAPQRSCDDLSTNDARGYFRADIRKVSGVTLLHDVEQARRLAHETTSSPPQRLRPLVYKYLPPHSPPSSPHHFPHCHRFSPCHLTIKIPVTKLLISPLGSTTLSRGPSSRVYVILHLLYSRLTNSYAVVTSRLAT